MKLNKIPLLATASVVFALASGCAVAGGDYYLNRHPNIAAADDYIARAIDRLHAAQDANDHRLGGHAGRAIELLQQARREAQEAARSAG
jgi:hypothetical protein